MLMRSTRGKMVVKALVVTLVILMALPLAGCNKDAAPLKEGFLKSLEINSSRSVTTFNVVNNVPKDQLSQDALAVFALLEKGFNLEIDMAGLTSMSMVLTPNEDDILRIMGIWPYPQDPSLEFFMDEGRMAVRTAADPFYLVLDPGDAMLAMPGEGVDVSSIFGVDYTASQMERAMDFVAPFMRDYDFTLSRVESLGSVELELPDGAIEAQGYKVYLDIEELLALVTYTLEYMAKSEAMKDYLVLSMLDPMEKMIESGVVPPEELPTEEELDEMTEMFYQEFQKGILQAVDYLNNVSPGMLKMQFGLDLSATEEYYLDNEGFIRETRGTYNIKAEHEMLEAFLGTPKLDLTINSKQTVWDINKPVEVNFPSEEEQISFFALMGDPSGVAELGEGPLSLLANMAVGFTAYMHSSHEVVEVVEGRSLMIDPATGVVILDGKPAELETAPYLEGETIMVPFRTLAEMAGGEIVWYPDTRQVYYRDGKVEMKFSPGSTRALVNGKDIELTQPTELKDGRAMVPAELGGMLARHFVQEGSSSVFIF